MPKDIPYLLMPEITREILTLPMGKPVHKNVLFEAVDVFGTSVHTTKEYWEYIRTVKHQELTITIDQVIETITKPDEVYQSLHDPYIKLFYRTYDAFTLVVVVKYIQQSGFIITVYQTSKAKRKGEKLWSK